jgi:1,4-alpha-glucan branching enzyme
MQRDQQRRLPIGAEISPCGVHFRVWAPKRKRVEVQLEGGAPGEIRTGFPLAPEDGGYFAGHIPYARVGSLYRFRLDGGPQIYPDPASRFQPNGPHGPSQVIDPTPAEVGTFERCKLDWRERDCNVQALALHRDLLRLRREDPVLCASHLRGVDGAVLAPQALVLRYFGGDHGDRLLLLNLGRDWNVEPAPEPLLAPPEDQAWALAWSSEEPRYGGNGALPPEIDGRWRLPGEAAVLLRPALATTTTEEESPEPATH